MSSQLDATIASMATIRRAQVDAPTLAAGASPPIYSLLATACVAPAAHPGLQRSDPVVRRQDYLAALAPLAILDDPRLGPMVVLENSGVDPEQFLQRLLASLRQRPPLRSIEVSYVAPPRPPLMHYGYAEFQMMDELMDHSTSLTPHSVNVTGRYRFPALSRLLDHIPVPPAFLCDAQNIPALLGRSASQTTNTEIFFASRAFFDERVRRLYKRMQPSLRLSHVENVMYDELRPEYGRSRGVFFRLPINCDPVGVCGNGQRLTSGGRRMKSAVRGVARHMVPGIWL